MIDVDRDPGHRALTPALSAIFFLSGAAALIFETLWFRQAGLAVGNSVWATSIVLASFMGGLALGNALAARHGGSVTRPILVYAGLELAIAASGVLLVVVLPHLADVLAPVFRPLLDRPLLLNPLRLTIAFALLLLPATAMGATLPILVKALSSRDPHFGQVLGRLYGWNTLGAVAGALAGEAVLIERLGVLGTGLAAASLDLIAAVGAVAASRYLAGSERVNESARVSRPARRLTFVTQRVLAAAFLSGGLLLALEVVWFRFLGMFFSSTSAVLAAMLAVVLLGIGAGGLVASRWLRLDPEASRFLAPLALLMGILTVAVYAGFHRGEPADLVPLWYGWPKILGGGLRLMLPVSLLSGILFTLLGEAVNREIDVETRAAGWLTMANTIGAMIGSLLAGFVLVPGLGMERSFFVLALGYGVVALVVPPPPRRQRSPVWRLALGAGLALFALHGVLFPFGLMQRHYFAALALRFGSDGSKPVAIREGIAQTIVYLRRDFEDFGVPNYYRLCTDSFWMSGTTVRGRRYMKLFVYWPIAVHPAPRRALLISYGVGMTAKALADTRELERIDVVDTSREILEMSGIVFPDPAQHPLLDPRVRVHVEDGRHFLQVTDERYDLITGEPPPPKVAGVVSLYSREYFQLIRDRLDDGGIATYWLPVHALGSDEARSILRGFCDVFDDCSLWIGYGMEWMMVGTREARGPVSEERFARQWQDPVVGAELRAVAFERPEQLGAQLLAGTEELRELTRDALPLVDNYPRRLSTRVDRTWLKAESEAHSALVDIDDNRRAFERSALVRRLWPPGLRERSIVHFETRRIIDTETSWAPPSTAGLDELDEILTKTSLETLPLWMLGTSVHRQSIASVLAARGSASGLAYWEGVGALAHRAYDRAATALERAQAERPNDPGVVQMRALALGLGGRRDELALLAERELQGEMHRPFRRWLESRFALAFPGGAEAPTSP
ncbi:MAG: spermidine synthase [Acidobacteria bacterium]|nr:spermidine synthase [Acidobacteriota bacterium]